jgi:hypothetical protein
MICRSIQSSILLTNIEMHKKKFLSKNLFFIKCNLRTNKLIETFFSEPRNKNSLDFVKKKVLKIEF